MNIPEGSSKIYEANVNLGVEFPVTRAYASPFEDIFAEVTSLDHFLLHDMQLIPTTRIQVLGVELGREFPCYM